MQLLRHERGNPDIEQCWNLSLNRWFAWRTDKGYGHDARFQGVRQSHSTKETSNNGDKRLSFAESVEERGLDERKVVYKTSAGHSAR